MSAPKSKGDQTIRILVNSHVNPPIIDLGTDYAVSAWRGSKVTWVMGEGQPFPFAVKFDPRSDLKAEPRSPARDIWDVMIPDDLPEHLIYKYTIAVGIDLQTVLILDPVLAPIPPEN